MKPSSSKLKRSLLPGLVVVVCLLIHSCTNRNWEKLHPYGQSSSAPAPCDTSAVVSYSTTIQPIIATQCATTSACHASGATLTLDYTVFSNVQSDGNFSHGHSQILDRLSLPAGDPSHMPQNLPSLPTCDIMKIHKWVYEGCPQN